MNNVEGRRTESQPRGPEVLLGEVLALLNAIRAQSPRSLFLGNFRLVDKPLQSDGSSQSPCRRSV